LILKDSEVKPRLCDDFKKLLLKLNSLRRHFDALQTLRSIYISDFLSNLRPQRRVAAKTVPTLPTLNDATQILIISTCVALPRVTRAVCQMSP